MLVEAEEAKNFDTECLYTALYHQIQNFFKGLTATPPSYIGSRNNFPGPPWSLMSFEINRRKCAEGVIRLVGAILEGQQIQAYGNKWIDRLASKFRQS